MSNKKKKGWCFMRTCKQQKKALRSVRNRQIKRRVQARKLNKRRSQESESANARMARVNQLLNKILREKKV